MIYYLYDRGEYMNTKKGVTILITMVFITIIILGLFVYIKNLKTEIINGNQTVNDINFKDVSLEKKDSKYIFKVTLSSNKEINIESFDVVITDKKGKKLDVLSGYVGNISKGETKIVEIETTKDLSKAYKVSYIVYNE